MTCKRIGVWQTAFLGDAVLTLPLLQTLAGSFPGSDIYFFVRKGLKSLFNADMRYNVIEFDKNDRDRGVPGIAGIISKIRKLKFNLWISPHTSLRSALIARGGNALTRIGYNHPLHNLFAYTITVPRRFDDLDEIERILELANPLKIVARETWPAIVLDREARRKADDFWNNNIRGKTIGIHPGSTWPTKQWPEQYYSQIINMARSLPQTQIVIFAGPDEKHIVRQIRSGIKNDDHVIDLSGTLSLPQLAAYLAKLDCYLTNDSGPMHLAWPQNVPVIALFGPTTGSLGFKPRGHRATVLETELPCRPCGLHGHKECPEKHHKCMKSILPETVMDQIRKKLHG